MPRATTITTDTCPLSLCDGSGFVVDDATNTATDCRCRAQRLSQARARSLTGTIPRKYRGVSFDRSPVTQIAPAITAAVKRYVNRIDDQLDAGRGLWFQGSVGTGKTTLAMLVSQHAIQAGRSVAIYSLPRLLADIRKTVNDDDRSRSYVDLIDRLAAVDLLHVDDVGAEKTSEWVLEQLYAIVNARYEDERSIVITTNLERDALAAQINERTVSRLEEMCEILPLWGEDARQQRADMPSA
ncbi:MAG: replication protein DnaC [Solirubrobacteraceae bacterium]|jgi:DNA replication protein DnaC|nr:replication protein DnaC [Solirubrobacteraceae bacterium]